jgi:hypothetical protein
MAQVYGPNHQVFFQKFTFQGFVLSNQGYAQFSIRTLLSLSFIIEELKRKLTYMAKDREIIKIIMLQPNH